MTPYSYTLGVRSLTCFLLYSVFFKIREMVSSYLFSLCLPVIFIMFAHENSSKLITLEAMNLVGQTTNNLNKVQHPTSKWQKWICDEKGEEIVPKSCFYYFS